MSAAAPTLHEDRTGKDGVLRLRLERREGRTVVADQYWRLPLQTMPASYQDEDDQAWVYLLNPTGGIVQGDRLRAEIELGLGARALVTTQSATKVYRATSGQAEESNRFVLAPGAALEFLPDPTIPFAASRLHRRTTVDLDPSSTVILAELLAAGRLAREERFALDRLVVEVEFRVAGARCLADRLELEPARGALDRLGLWDGHAYHGSLYACSPRIDASLAARLAGLVEGRAGIYGGAGQPLPNTVVARALGSSAEAMRQLLLDAWDVLRRPLLGKPARPLRKP
jgi:urease accessory protein